MRNRAPVAEQVLGGPIVATSLDAPLSDRNTKMVLSHSLGSASALLRAPTLQSTLATIAPWICLCRVATSCLSSHSSSQARNP